MARNKWIPIVVGIVIFVVVVGIGLIGAAIYVFTRQVGFQTVETASGQQQFEKLRARFEGQVPFIELTAGDEGGEPRAVIHRELAKGETGTVSKVHIRVWSPDERKLVSLDLPFWMIRFMGSKRQFWGPAFQDRKDLLTEKDERYQHEGRDEERMKRYGSKEVEAEPLMTVEQGFFIAEKERAPVRIYCLKDREKDNREREGKQTISERGPVISYSPGKEREFDNSVGNQ